MTIVKEGCKMQNGKTFYCVDCRECLHPKECKKICEYLKSTPFNEDD